DRDADRLRELAVGEVERAAGRDIIAARGRAAILRLVIHVERAGAAGAGDGEGHQAGAGIALRHGDVVDRDKRRLTVVIDDRACGNAVADRPADRIGEGDGEILVQLWAG